MSQTKTAQPTGLQIAQKLADSLRDPALGIHAQAVGETVRVIRDGRGKDARLEEFLVLHTDAHYGWIVRSSHGKTYAVALDDADGEVLKPLPERDVKDERDTIVESSDPSAPVPTVIDLTPKWEGLLRTFVFANLGRNEMWEAELERLLSEVCDRLVVPETYKEVCHRSARSLWADVVQHRERGCAVYSFDQFRFLLWAARVADGVVEADPKPAPKPEPEADERGPVSIGMGATIMVGTDSYPATVIAVKRRSGAGGGQLIGIKFREDSAVRLDFNGPSEVQEYDIRPDPQGRIWDAKWDAKAKAWRATNRCPIKLGVRRRWHDYSF